MSDIYIKCSFCHRNTINYKSGNFFLINFKNESNQDDNNLKIIKENQKWFCDLHYPVFYKYKDMTWTDVKKKIKN
jgi:hypothetical protein